VRRVPAERPPARAVRERILARAEELFHRRGVSPVTMDEIASGLGMSKKTLYQHFPSKDRLASAAMDRAFAEADRALEIAITSDGDFGARLERYAQVLAERYLQMEGPLIDDLERTQPVLHARFLERSRALIARRFGQLLAAGVAAGELRGDLDPRLVHAVVEALSEKVLPRALRGELGIEPRHAFRATFDLLLDGLRARRRRD
jgi:AcrR family transcriptional regulator